MAYHQPAPSATWASQPPPPPTGHRGSYPPSVRPPLPALPVEYEALARAPSPLLHSPRPTRPPTQVPTGALETQASVINAIPPYSPPATSYQRLPSPAPYSVSGGRPLPSHTASPSFQSSPSFQQPARWSSSSLAAAPPPPPPIPPRTPLLQQQQPPSISTHNVPSFAVHGSTPIEAPSIASTYPNPSYNPYSPLDPVQQNFGDMALGAGGPQAARRGSPAGTGSNASRNSSGNGAPRRGSADSAAKGGSLALPQPTIADLATQRATANASGDTVQRVKWARSLLRFLERTQSGSSIDDPRLVSWIDEAVRLIVAAASAMPPVAEALYLRADLAMSGTFPSLIAKDKKRAFRDFEAAANAEYAQAWYRIGREYEHFKDMERAKSAYDSGLRLGDVTSTYRLGMAYLLGQLDLQQDPRRALDLLKRAAVIADQVGDVETATPLFVWGMILAGEFEAPSVDSTKLPHDSAEAGRWIRKAAYLNHAGAQHKMGQAYEYAQLGEAFDPVMSLQYFSLSSQQGDAESDLALSKWFLCGAEGCFDMNESLAFTFAEKAASKGLAAGEFALGYYYELGIGTSKDIGLAKRWYGKALAQGNEDARGRLDTLSTGAATLSRAEHEAAIDDRLTRKHTQAKMRSDSQRRGQPKRGSAAIGQALQRVDEAAHMPMPMPVPSTSTSTLDPKRASPPRASTAGMKRYTLNDTPSPQIDAGVMPAPKPSKQTSMPVRPRPSASSSPPKPVAPASAAVAVKKPGPSTFAEMGIESTRLKKEECTIM